MIEDPPLHYERLRHAVDGISKKGPVQFDGILGKILFIDMSECH